MFDLLGPGAEGCEHDTLFGITLTIYGFDHSITSLFYNQ